MEVDKTRFGFAIAAATIFCTISLDTVESDMADHHYEATNVPLSAEAYIHATHSIRHVSAFTYLER